MSEGAPETPVGEGVWRGRLRLAAAVLLGAAAVGVGWLILGGGDAGSTASFQVSPGIPPVVFGYLDNVHIASYLAQLQGGAATTEMLSQQATQSRNASAAANGVGVGASASQESAAQLSLTVTDQSRFTTLLGLLQARGFLHTIDMAASDSEVTRQFAAVTPGTFVKLSDCTLALPSYVQDEQLWRAAKGRINANDLFVGSAQGTHELLVQRTAITAFKDRQRAQGLGEVNLRVDTARNARIRPQNLARARAEMTRLVRRVGPDPRVPLSSCSPGYDPNVPDLLMPVRLGELSSSGSALTGHVTLVGKIMLAVKGRIHIKSPGMHHSYVDLPSLQQWAGAQMWTSAGGLADDATVLGPGYLIQPIAIYK